MANTLTTGLITLTKTSTDFEIALFTASGEEITSSGTMVPISPAGAPAAEYDLILED